MIRLVVQSDQTSGQVVRLNDRQQHYLTRVMRVSSGAAVELLIPGQGLFAATLESAGQMALGERIAERVASPVQLTLAQALLKQDRMSEIIEKGTEAGIGRFIPLLTERTIVRDVSPKRLVRWRSIAAEAAEQSRGGMVPEVVEPVSLKIFSQEKQAGLCLDPEGPSLAAWLRSRPSDTAITLVVGPEGGLTGNELNRLDDIGFCRVSLGPRILRAENAGVYAAVLLHFWFGEALPTIGQDY
ncbi:MAG: RsmE family RNA methyltransferase [Thermaerobacter sp.]|nr:RsmE family RNA methyltransferase [Thermaerobacter sp.]